MATVTASLPDSSGSWALVADDVARLERTRVRAVLWLTLAFWGSNVLLLTIGTALAGNQHLGSITAVRSVTTILGLSFCYLIHRLLTHPALKTMRRRLLALALVAPIAAETFAWISYFAEAAVDPALRAREFTWSGAVRTIAFWTWFFLAWAGLYLAVSYSFDVQEEQRRSAALAEQAHLAQLRALHSQINPHFLFNSLNSVSALILDGEMEQADRMVVKLARFLRMGLAADPSGKIRLAAEVAFQRTYLEIEQLRYHDLQIRIDLPQELANALVPSLILQPIIENSVKYGVAGAPPPARIDISAWSSDERLFLQISDTGKGAADVPSGTGIGLANARRRLQLLYRDCNADLTTGREEDGTFRVRLSLPLEFA